MKKLIEETITKEIVVCNICEEPSQEFLHNFPDTHFHFKCLLDFYLRFSKSKKK